MTTYECSVCHRHFGTVYVDPESDDWICVACAESAGHDLVVVRAWQLAKDWVEPELRTSS